MQTRGRGIGDAQRQINTVIDKIQRAIFQPQADIHLRVAMEKRHHQRVDHKAADGFRYAERQLSLSDRLATAGGIYRLPRRFQHLLGMLIHCFPGIAQSQLAGGTMQQLAAHLPLQPRHAAAHGGGRQSALAGDGGKAALVDNLDEEGEVRQEV